MYPSKNFSGVFKNILYLLMVFPFIYTPIEVLRLQLNPINLLLSAGLVILVNTLALLVWKNGIRLAESGSNFGVNAD